MPPRAPLFALWLALSTAYACNRNPASSEGPAQPPPSASGPSTPPGSASGPAAGSASADAQGPADAPPPSASGPSDLPRPPGSSARDPGRYRAPVVMQVRGSAGAQPGPIVVTIDVREPVQAPGKLALSYPLPGGATGRKELSVSLTEVGTQTHTVPLEAGALAPVRVTLDASDPARGSGLHAERLWPEASQPAPSTRPPGPPGGRPPLPRPAE